MSDSTGPADRSALGLLISHRPRNVGWRQAAGLLFGDWGTSRLYVLGLAFFFAPQASLWLLVAMSLLMLAVGWAYTQICRVYPDGGGVYSAARRVSRTVAVIGALLLFADYVVTASLSSLDAFHYFFGKSASSEFFSFYSPGLWAMVAILFIGLMNLLGPRHTGVFAAAVALGMVVATIVITGFAMPQVNWHALPSRVDHVGATPLQLWTHFVAIVLALSGVEAIGNLTGVMKKPIGRTSRRAIWIVAGEVALFNVLLGIAMVARLSNSQNVDHKEDMMAFLALSYAGPAMELVIRILGGVLLLSAVNTVVTDMISLQYLLSRDGELPRFLQKLNRFGVPWIGAMLAMVVPCLVLLFVLILCQLQKASDPNAEDPLVRLAALYAIGVVGAVAINITLLAHHPRLHGPVRKVAATLLGVFLVAIWVTLAATKHEALIFVCIVMAVGMTARWFTRRFAKPLTNMDLLRTAILDQLNPDALAGPKVLLATAGSLTLASTALEHAKQQNAALVVSFVRDLALSAKQQRKYGLETDVAAQTMFAHFLEQGQHAGVVIIPVYDAGPNPAELIAEAAAILGVSEVLLGSSRRGTLHRLIKGSFQRHLEALLPQETRVTILAEAAPSTTA